LAALTKRWRFFLLVCLILLQTFFVLQAVTSRVPPPIYVDSALYQHGGWSITQGAVPYRDIWDITPPFTFESTTVLALLSGGNRLTLHLLSVLATSAAAVTTAMLLAEITFGLTNSAAGAVASALTLFAFAGFPLLATGGFVAKHMTLFMGVLCLYFQLKRRPLISGVFGALSVGYWLFGAMYLLLSLGLALQHGRWRAVMKTIVGTGITVLLLLLPIALWGALEIMFVEVVLAPLLLPEHSDVLPQIGRLADYLGPLLLVVVPSAVCLFPKVVQDFRRYWWVAAGLLIFLFQLLFLDFDNFPDMFQFIVFASLTVGIFAGTFRVRQVGLVVAAVLVIVIAAIVVQPESARRFRLGILSLNLEEPAPEDPPGMERIYWLNITPESCYYRRSKAHRGWAAYMQIDLSDASSCGRIGIAEALNPPYRVSTTATGESAAP
jgi:dolichol phosphate-mannose mannosyltransferase